jgi:polysaccharide export outer membrane protein
LNGRVPIQSPANAVEQSSSSAAKTNTEYELGPDDVVNVVVQQHPEWSGNYTIQPSGNIVIPAIGEVKLQGLVKEGAEVAITERLNAYINAPKVSVQVVTYASQSIYILGEVNRPGKYSTGGKNITLRDAIVLAGLPTRFAAERRVFIITPSSRQKHAEKVVDLSRVLYKGDLANNLPLKTGDVIYVPKNVWGHISDFLSTILSPFNNTVPAAKAAVLQ